MKIPVILSLLVLLPSSSFFLDSYLKELFFGRGFTQAQLDYGVKRRLPAAWQVLLQQAQYGSNHWIRISENLAHTDAGAAYRLAVYYQEKGNNSQAVFWYQLAIKQGFAPAQLALATLYFDDNKFAMAKTITAKKIIAQNEDEYKKLLNLSMEIEIALGNIGYVNRYLNELNSSGIGQTLLKKMAHFQVTSIDRPWLIQDKSKLNSQTYEVMVENNCKASIALFATNLKDLDYLEQLVVQFSSQPLASFVCFSPVRYRPLPELSCQQNNGQAIKCQETLWANEADTIKSRYIGVLLPEGGANVHLGIMYLDRKDTLAVFTHEIAHLLGFIDEYPLPPEHNKCALPQELPFSHNIVVLASHYQGRRAQLRAKLLRQIPWANQIKPGTPILQQDENGWLLGTPQNYASQVGIFAATTCDGHKQQAFKALSRRTQLTYYEETFPGEYIQRLTMQPEQFLMPSFHYNIALALYREGQIKAAKYWLEQAALWETSNQRRQIVLAGDY